jgi:phosphoserine phosphatase RsbU/P
MPTAADTTAPSVARPGPRPRETAPPRTSLRATRGLGFKLALCILASTTCIFALAFTYYYQASKDLLLKNVRENARNLIRGAAARIDGHLAAMERIPRYLAHSLGEATPAEETLRGQLQDALAASPDIYGMGAAYAPNAFRPGLEQFAPYFFREGGRLEYLGSTEDYSLQDWYLVPTVLGRPVWSEPYFDESGPDIVMSSYSVPFYRGQGQHRQLLGVVTADVSLDWLRRQVGKIAMYHSGYAFLVSANGVFVSHPDNRAIMRESIFSLAEAAGSEQLRAIGRDMIRGREGFARLPDFVLGKPAWLAYTPMPVTGWSMGVIVPEDELFADLSSLGRQVAILGGGGFCLLLAVIVAIAASITRPLGRLAATAAAIARGNLDVPTPATGAHDEVGVLARSFDQMRLALKDYIANLTATTKAKERLESELKIARNIQMSFLPKRFPPFPDITAFDLHAALEPAWEVGGDLYDFFLTGDGRLLFLVGDVSGKGVPAALFMAVTKTLIKGIAEQESDPAQILTKVNRELCVDNESMLFVTLFLAILDTATGELSFSNAGHNPPARIDPEGAASWLSLPRGVFLGIMEEAVYRTATTTLVPGETLVAYTDGVTEAMDPAQRLFGSARLLDLLAERSDLAPEAMDAAVMDAVRAFAGDAPQADDITVLALRFHGQESG